MIDRSQVADAPETLQSNRVLLTLLVLLLLVCYHSVIWITVKLVLFSDDMAHGLFAPLVALYVGWIHREYLFHPVAPPSSWAVLILVLAGCLGVAASVANSSTFSRIALLISMVGCLLVAGGWPALKRFQFPVLLFLFAFPIPTVLYGELTQPLQLLATSLSKFSLELLGFSVLREGNILQLAHMQLSVVEACSGLRSLVTLCFICVVYSYFFESKLWLRIAIVLLAVPSAILVNALRITCTGVLGKYDRALTIGLYHDVLGWICLVFGLLMIIAVHGLASKYAVLPHKSAEVGEIPG